MNLLLKVLKFLMAFLVFPLVIVGSSIAHPVKVVYHIDDTQVQGLKALRNIRNHLDVSPQTRIIVVTHALGVDLLMQDSKDQKNDVSYASLVTALKSRGVIFEVCEITLKNRNLTKDQFILEADFTLSGVARIADLQFNDRSAYIKP